MSDLHLEELIVPLVKPLVDHPDDIQRFQRGKIQSGLCSACLSTE